MLASTLSSAVPDHEICKFIRSYTRISRRLHEMTVNDLWGVSLQTLPTAPILRPVKAFPIEIGDLTRCKIPVDSVGSRRPLRELLLVRNSMASANVSPIGLARTKTPHVFSQPQNILPLSNIASCGDGNNTSERVILAKDVAQAISRAYESRPTHCCELAHDPTDILQHAVLENNNMDPIAASISTKLPSEYLNAEKCPVDLSSNGTVEGKKTLDQVDLQQCT